MNNDAALLRSYAEKGSEAAFTELVRRHVDLVYGAALRRTNGDTHRAADVAQSVFVSLARQAGKLSSHAVLSAWLHQATRNAAINLMISEKRRQAREMEAQARESSTGAASPSPEWERLRPVLDAAIDELPEADRTTVILRFLEHRAFADIGAALKISDDAARMRTDRALEKLRVQLARRGITSTAAALGSIVLGSPLIAAPVGLGTALATYSLASAGSGIFTSALIPIMSAKTITTAALAAFLAFGLGAYLGRNHGGSADAPPAQAQNAQQSLIDSLVRETQALKAENARLKADVDQIDAVKAEVAGLRAAAVASAAKLKPVTLGMSRGQMQQTILSGLRQIDAAREQFLLENHRPPASVTDLVGLHGYIKNVRTVDGEDYSALSMESGKPLTVSTPDGMTVTYDPAGVATTTPEWNEAELKVQDLGQRVEPAIRKAVEAYRTANNGRNPPNESAVLPYFSTPQEAVDAKEYMVAKKAAGL